MDNKISIIGSGNVGMTCAFSILLSNITNKLVIIGNKNLEKLKGEYLDLNDCCKNVNITVSLDYEKTKNSKICVITSGVKQNKGEDRISLLQRNIKILYEIIPEIVKYNPNTIFLIVSNPVDILTYVVWKISKFPKNRVIGTGTSLDNNRLICFLKNLNIHLPQNTFVIGEHGEDVVILWSKIKAYANVEKFKKHIYDKVSKQANNIINLKGHTNYAISVCVLNIIKSIMHNKYEVYPVTTNIKKYYNFKQDVFLSLPCIINKNGIFNFVHETISETEYMNLSKVYDKQISILKDI